MVAALVAVVPSHADGQAVFYDRPSWTVGVAYGRFSADPNLPRDLRIHSNHADDPFLVGSPGETDLERIEVDFVRFELGAAYRLGYRNVALLGHYVTQIPLSESGRLERQQANDARPPSQASFIYTKLVDAGVAHALGAGFGLAIKLSEAEEMWLEVQGFVDVGRWNMSFEKGWTRFGRDQAEEASAPSGLYVSPNLRALIGTRRFSLVAGAGLPRITFEHPDPRLGRHTSNGFDFSLGLRLKF